MRHRSGLVESTHHGTVAVAGRDGELVASFGEIDRPFYLRSAAKPFQALVSQEAGAALSSIQLALAAASHRGHPVHVGIVEGMLGEAGLEASHLRCPPSWPLSQTAARRLVARGEAGPRQIWNNCSGKHAGFLRACASSGWPLDSYLDPAHPLQRRIIEVVSQLSQHPVEPVGTDGCGAPVLRTTARAMARLFTQLGNLSQLEEVFTAMHRYPALVSSNGEGDASIAVATNSAAKGGAQGCIGVSVRGGRAFAVKSWDGSSETAVVAAISALEQIGDLWPEAMRRLDSLARPVILGGGDVVGAVEPRLDLSLV